MSGRPVSGRQVKRSGLRLFSGELRGRRLEVPRGVRPTEARVREALAAMWRGRLGDAIVLDLFAGSGAVGLEALSLGASRVVLVDQAPPVLRALRANTSGLGAVEIVCGRLPDALATGRVIGPFDLVFADPPYAFEGYASLLKEAAKLLAVDGELVLEHSVRAVLGEVPEGLAKSGRRTYGETCLSFFAGRRFS